MRVLWKGKRSGSTSQRLSLSSVLDAESTSKPAQGEHTLATKMLKFSVDNFLGIFFPELKIHKRWTVSMCASALVCAVHILSYHESKNLVQQAFSHLHKISLLQN